VQVKDSSDSTTFLTNIKAIAAGSAHNLALKNDGTVRAWGDNDFDQLGDGISGDRNYPVQVKNPSDSTTFLTGVKAIAAAQHSMVLKTNGTVWAWGHNGFGQLGDGSRRPQ
jgi:alpha-tubulin suppressor-like RCC1 family protein